MLLSVLDQSPIAQGATGVDALRNTLDLARLTEELGFHRYWVAEHHGGPMLAGASPEVLISAIGAATSEMRIGSGGVMLPHYSPFKVAETFTILAALYPGRIDLGIGRAAGTDPLTTYALQRDRREASADDFPQQLVELLGYFEDGLPDDHPFKRLARVLPGLPELPATWLLGSSPQSAIWAAELGLPYAFADFINPAGAEFARTYREQFQPVRQLQTHRTAVAVWVVCADTDAEAERLATSSTMAFAMLRRGELIPVPSPETAQAFLARQAQPADGSIPGRRRILGTPKRVRAGIEQVASEYGAEEVIVVTITYDHEARRHSYELIADAMGLPRREPAASHSGVAGVVVEA